MKVLCIVPHSRTLLPSIRSILALEWDDCLDTCFLATGDTGEPYDNITAKYQRGRRMALEGNYDALLTVEDDQLVPPDALLKLADTGADVAQGLTCWRHPPHRWSVALEHGRKHVTVDQQPQQMESLWGAQDYEVIGVGLYCTLIRRGVLEVLELHRDTTNCCDWDFALDIQGKFTHCVDFGVVCGHITGERVVWPHPLKGFVFGSYERPAFLSDLPAGAGNGRGDIRAGRVH